MKKLSYVLVSMLMIVSAAMAERVIGEGWYNTSVLGDGVRIGDSNMTISEGSPISEVVPISTNSSKILRAAALRSTEVQPEEIINLAKMLDNDPSKIIEYVATSIKTELYYGIKKGPLLTLYEKSGNDYDKTMLAMALLKAAGADTDFYIVKTIDLIPLDNNNFLNGAFLTLSDMFGITADLSVTANEEALVNKAFITRVPIQVGNVTIDGNPLRVAVMPRHKIGRLTNEGGNFWELCGKKKSLSASYDVKGEIGVVASDILTSAGGTLNVANRTVTTLNETNLGTKLKNLSSKLAKNMSDDVSRPASELTGRIDFTTNKNAITRIKNGVGLTFENFYGKEVAQLIGIYNAANGDKGIFLNNTNREGLIATFYNTIQPSDYAKLRIYDGTATTASYTMNLADLKGERLWVYFEGNTGYLKLGNTTIFTKANVGESMALKFEIQHGYDEMYDTADYVNLQNTKYAQSETFRKGNAFVYNIAYGYSDANALLAKRQGIYADKLAAAKAVSGNFDANGKFVITGGNLNATQKDLLAEGLNIMGLTWLSETYKADKMVASAYNTYSQFEHRMGKIAQEEGFYIDVKLQMGGNVSPSLSGDDENGAFKLSTFFLSSMEHGVIQQLQDGAEAISTVNIFHYANTRNNPFIILRNDSQVDSLSTYSAAEKTALKAEFGKYPSCVILIPQNRTCVPTAWDWQGYGYVVLSDSVAGMMISGSLNGGFSAYTSVYTPVSTYTQIASAPNYSYVNRDFSYVTTINNSFIPTMSIPKYYGADPVDMFTGAYTYETQDVSAGDTLTFNRMYNSNLNESKDSGLGFGWVHNYDISATPRTAWEESLGNGTAEQASALVASIYAAKEVFSAATTNDAELAKAWSTAALIAKWGIDGMLDNSVSIRIGKEAMQFVKQYKNTGTAASPVYSEYYAAPAGTNYKLIKNSSNKYELSAPYGEKMVFNTNNKIESITTLCGRKTSFTYNSAKKLTTVTDPFSRTLTLTWSGEKISAVSCMGKTASFSYTGDNLTSCTDAVSKVWNYEYDANNRMTVLKNPNNGGSVVVRNVYSDSGAVIEQYSCGDDNKKWTLSYLGNRSEEKDPLGNIKKYYYDERGFCTRITDPRGYSTTFEYDAQGREIKRGYPQMLQSAATGENGVITQNYVASRVESVYDNWHNKLSEKVVEIPFTLTITPGENDTATISKIDGTESIKAETTFAYETTTDGSVPRLLSVAQKGLQPGETDRVKTINSYYTKSAVKTNLPLSATDERGIDTVFTYGDYGVLLTETVGGRKTTYSNFQYDNPRKITYPDGTYESVTFNTLGDVLTSTDTAGLVTTFTYDNKRRVVATSQTGTGISTPITTSTTYDNAGNIASQTDPDGVVSSTVWNAQQKKLSDTIGTGTGALTTAYGYDLADRQVSTTLPDGKVVVDTLDAAGNTLTTTSGGQTTTYTYDGRNQVKTVKSHLGNTVSYAYDVLGNKISMTDAKGKTVTYAYNSFGEQTSLTNRRNGIFQMVNNLSERKTTLTTPTGKISTTNYATGTWDVASTVSPAGNTTTNTYNTTTGRLTSSADTVGTVNYTYDTAGRVSGVTQGTDAITYVFDKAGRMTTSTSSGASVTYAYTQGGKISTITYPAVNGVAAKTVTYAYDALGRLSTITDWANRVTTYTYDSGNRLTRIDRPNGTYRELTYDAATGNLTGIFEKASSTESIFEYTYAYDGDNRITGITRSPKGRIFPRNSYTATYDLDNKLQTFRGLTIAYDGDGNMTSGPITESATNVTLSYNARGELTSTGNVAYAYDAEGNRSVVMFYDKSILTQYKYVYNKSGEINEVLMRIRLTSKESESTYYVYGAGLEYEVKIATDGTETVRYYHFDQLGSTIALSDPSKAVTDRFHYDSWGYCIHSMGDSDTPFKYVGAYGVQTDPNGLINMRARYYNPATMSFVSSDPSGFGGGLNWYQYASGNPISRIDINGMWDGSISSSYSPPSKWNAMLSQLSHTNTADIAQTVLSGLGMIPVIGNAFDVANSAISAMRGNYGESAIHLAAAMPFVGLGVGAAKTTYSVVKTGSHVMNVGAKIGMVGSYNTLKKIKRGMNSGLDAHHVGQAAIMRNLVKNYKYETAPAILVPTYGHRYLTNTNLKISTSTGGISSARDLLARDIREMRRVFKNKIPNSSYKELIELNKHMYPEMR